MGATFPACESLISLSTTAKLAASSIPEPRRIFPRIRSEPLHSPKEKNMTKRYSAIAPLFLASLAVVVSSGVFAQSAADYPHKPIRVIVPFSPGGGSDVIARLVGARLSERLGQTVVVDNRPAAAGIVGTDIVAKASPDGYTLLLVTASHAVSAKLATKLPYDPIKDFSPITEVIASPFGALLQPSLPATTMKEFIAYAKANPGKLNYGSSGAGGSPHLATELLMSMTGL